MLKPFILMVISDYLKHQYKWDPLIIGFEGDVVRPGGNTNKMHNPVTQMIFDWFMK